METSSCQNHACKDQQEYRNTRANPITLPEFLSASRRDKQERAGPTHIKLPVV
jgi:hypothetical protein